ncbi:MAG TPA: hypothetical protein VEU27_10485 [Gemmatimonadales bacterium]|nr:hypothetical protein [Gemmatimonadales bacterium]
MFKTVKQLGMIALAAGLGACSSTGPSAGGSTVSFNTATHAGTPPAASLASLSTTATPFTVTLGANTVVLTDVQLVARHIEFQRQGKDVVCENDVNHEQDCEELNVGPVLLDLTLAPGASQSFSVQVPAGTYDKAELHVHRVSSSDTADAAFLAANPGFDGVSIKATGTYNGTPFTFTTDLDAEQEIALSPPITTDGSTPMSVTLFVDVSSWFKTADGTGLVDPATALLGQPNQSLVENNIKNSLKAFEDENHDGVSDH